MCENEVANLDAEFKRYLHILRPYLGQLMEQEDIEICNAWVQKLTNCPDVEKLLRNKYVFQLCYQLSKGVLENPFLKIPPDGPLEPLPEISDSESSTEVEYIIFSAEPSTKVLFNNRRPFVSDTDYQSQENEYVDQQIENGSDFDSKMPSPCSISTAVPLQKQTVICYTCPQMIRDNQKEGLEDEYGFRANNLIMKLREIKQQNMQLHAELMTLKEETRPAAVDEALIKVDTATNASLEENPAWQSLLNKIREFQDIRNSLVETITTLQNKLDNHEEIKKIEIEEVVANHKMEILKVKCTAQDEVKHIYEKKIDELRQHYENNMTETLQNESKILNKIKEEHNKLLNEKESEISFLKQQLEEQKNNLQTLLSKLIEKPNENNNDSFKLKALELEKRLDKVEKSKAKCAKSYEAKLAYLQREKHLTDCSLQLQLIKQRAQVVNDITEEHQVELNTTLEKLETKYKEIVANMQATAIQRRVQDQAALESILQAACNIKNDNIYYATLSQMSGKSPKEATQSYDSDASGVLHEKTNFRVSYGESSFGQGYCLDSERLGELFEKVYIPQRDFGDYKDISVNKP